MHKRSGTCRANKRVCRMNEAPQVERIGQAARAQVITHAIGHVEGRNEEGTNNHECMQQCQIQVHSFQEEAFLRLNTGIASLLVPYVNTLRRVLWFVFRILSQHLHGSQEGVWPNASRGTT